MSYGHSSGTRQNILAYQNRKRVTSLLDLEYSYTPPSSRLQAECGGEMFRFDAGESFGKRVGGHIVRRAINKVNRSVLNNKTDEMIAYVDVFRSSVVRPVTGECDSSLRVGVKWNRVGKWLKDFTNKSAKPNGFLGGMCGGNILGFSCRKSNEFLFLR